MTDEELQDWMNFHQNVYDRIHWYSTLIADCRMMLYKRWIAMKPYSSLENWCRDINKYHDFNECMRELSDLIF